MARAQGDDLPGPPVSIYDLSVENRARLIEISAARGGVASWNGQNKSDREAAGLAPRRTAPDEKTQGARDERAVRAAAAPPPPPAPASFGTGNGVGEFFVETSSGYLDRSFTRCRSASLRSMVGCASVARTRSSPPSAARPPGSRSGGRSSSSCQISRPRCCRPAGRRSPARTARPHSS